LRNSRLDCSVINHLSMARNGPIARMVPQSRLRSSKGFPE
jgi:hypothetical protein